MRKANKFSAAGGAFVAALSLFGVVQTAHAQTCSAGFGAPTTWIQSTGVDTYRGDRGAFFADVTGDRRADLIVPFGNIAYVWYAMAGNTANPDGFFTTERREWQIWDSSPTAAGDVATYFVDVNGDGKADSIQIFRNRTMVRTSDGSSFLRSSESDWTAGATRGIYAGQNRTFFADVTGDGKADAISLEQSSVVVRRSTGAAFGVPETWYSTGFWGTEATVAADIDGDGKSDLIVVNPDAAVSRLSTGSSFGDSRVEWGYPYYGSRGTFLADITGDNRADAIALNPDRIAVKLRTAPASTSSGRVAASEQRFADTTFLTTDSFLGEQANAFADVNGDGKVDAIAVNRSNVIVRLSRC